MNVYYFYQPKRQTGLLHSLTNYTAVHCKLDETIAVVLFSLDLNLITK